MRPSTLSIKWPIIGTWKVEGHQEAYQGVLFAEDDTVYLRIFLEIPGHPQQLFGNALDAHPRLAPFRPPHQPTVFGETRRRIAGKVTLLNCVLSKHEGTHQFDPPISRVEITLRVSQGWAGDGNRRPHRVIQCAEFYRSGAPQCVIGISSRTEIPDSVRPQIARATRMIQRC